MQKPNVNTVPMNCVSMDGLSMDDVRRAAAEVLGVEAGSIPDSANLIGHGMDSIRMMRLAGGWRREGASVTFRQLAQEPTVEAWHALLTAGRALPQTAGGRPVDAGAPFALTPVQRAYWIGRRAEMTLGGVGCHAYLEFDGSGVEPVRLEAAVRHVLARHGMLRARFLDDGRQQILARSPWAGLTVHDFASTGPDKAAVHLGEVRSRLSHRVFDVAAGEVVDVQLSLLPDGRTRIHFGIDLLVADVASIELVLADLAAAYRDPARLAPPPAYGFPQYLEDHRAWSGSAGAPGSPLAVAREFWRERVPGMPVAGPSLPLAAAPEDIEEPVFSRRSFTLAPPVWERITARAREFGLTPAMVLATAYAEVLGAWGENDHFLLNVPLFDRQPLDAEVGSLVADFTNLVLLSVDVRRPAPFAERALGLQVQLQENASHAQYSTLSVLQDLRRANGGARAGAPVVFACNLGSAFVPPEVREELGEWSWMISQTPQVWLDHQVYRTDAGVVLAWDSVDALFPEGLMDTMLRSYEELLLGLAGPEGAQDRADAWSRPAAVDGAGR
ncbi:condensation domain-containing protein [Streptomyces sp. G1]|uniref:condensation domain-containing protein n=1 Tax=Streptomyces sp. G1 TaxID=361572 RepID=UPI00203078B8|nr:condensation domain-containing protein [Streptomyces sp. G1]MCM1969375.1 condensation domain-containing protein [Streptomyces sp. G1]